MNTNPFASKCIDHATVAPRTPVLSALIAAACFSLAACGPSASGSSDEQLSAAPSSVDSADADRFAARGAALGDINVASSDSTDAAAEHADSLSPTAKAYAPTMTQAPSFGTGSFAVGAAFVRTVGVYPDSTPIAGRRYRNGTLIAGATSASYTLVAADIGQQLVYEEEVQHNVTKVRKTFRSAALTIGLTQPTMTAAPSFGTAAATLGASLQRLVGTYPGSTAVAGRRYRNNVLIAGSTGAAYTIVAADLGQQLVYEEDVVHNTTGVRKSFRSPILSVAAAPIAAPAPAPAPTPVPAPVPAPAPAPAAATLNNLDTVVADMRLKNDFILKGYESFKHGWYVGPGETHMGNNSSYSNSPTWSIFYNNPAYRGKSAKAMLPWVVIFDGVNNAASNVAVEMRNMRTYLKSRSTGRWTLIGGPSNVSGVYYGKPNTGLPASNEIVVNRTATSSAIKLPPNSGQFWHGWWGAGRLAINPADIGAFFVTVQARLVVADQAKPDDRHKAQIGLQVGADYYLDTVTTYRESYAPAIGINRTKTINNNWQAYSYTTLSDVGSQQPGGGITEAALRAAPPPME
jgi:hypothetical protein